MFFSLKLETPTVGLMKRVSKIFHSNLWQIEFLVHPFHFYKKYAEAPNKNFEKRSQNDDYIYGDVPEFNVLMGFLLYFCEIQLFWPLLIF